MYEENRKPLISKSEEFAINKNINKNGKIKNKNNLT